MPLWHLKITFKLGCLLLSSLRATGQLTADFFIFLETRRAVIPNLKLGGPHWLPGMAPQLRIPGVTSNAPECRGHRKLLTVTIRNCFDLGTFWNNNNNRNNKNMPLLTVRVRSCFGFGTFSHEKYSVNLTSLTLSTPSALLPTRYQWIAELEKAELAQNSKHGETAWTLSKIFGG